MYCVYVVSLHIDSTESMISITQQLAFWHKRNMKGLERSGEAKLATIKNGWSSAASWPQGRKEDSRWEGEGRRREERREDGMREGLHS